MRTVLIIYIAGYALVVGGMLLIYVFVIPRDDKKGDHWWTTPLDVLLAVLMFIGMLLLAISNDSTTLKTAWKVLAPTMVAIQLFVNIQARVVHMRATRDRSDVRTRAGDLAMLLFVSPALALNLVYAFSR